MLNLPVTDEDLVDGCLAVASALIRVAPNVIDDDHAPVFSGLIQARPDEMLVRLQPYVMAFPTNENAWSVADLLIQMKDLVINEPAGQLLMALLNRLISYSETYREHRGDYACAVVCAFLGSSLRENVVAAYHVLTSVAVVKERYTREEIAPVVQHLKSGVLWPCAVHLLARTVRFPLLPELVYGISLRAAESRLAVCTALRIAQSPDGAAMLGEWPMWTRAVNRFPDETFRVLATVWGNPEARRLLCRTEAFFTLLSRLAASKIRLVIATLPELLESIKLTEDNVEQLEEEHFLESIKESVEAIAEPHCFSYLFAAAAQLAKAGYSSEFKFAQNLAQEFVDDFAMRPMALKALVSLLDHAKCAKHLKKDEEFQGKLGMLLTDPFVGRIAEAAMMKL
jgi:hypothetical protein